MSNLLVVTGPPGAGKSTVAALVAEASERSVLVEGDAFFGFLARGGIDPWLREAHAQNEVVTRAAALATGGYALGGFDTVYDGVVGAWFLPAFMAATGLDELDYVVLLPSVETCLHRVATRRGHGFSDEPATRQMHAAFSAAEIDPRHVLVDPASTPAAVAEVVIDGWRAGTFTHAGEA
ncbi:MAG: AAA family ATPase [Acidimicrobiia bacterium]